MIPEAIGAPENAADALDAMDPERLAGDVDPESVAFVLDATARAMAHKAAPPFTPAALASTLLVAAALVRGRILPQPPNSTRTPDSHVLDVTADRLASLGDPPALIMAATCRRIARELAEELTASRAAADVWDAATAHATRGLMGPASARQKFRDRMAAERNRRWPKLAPRGDDERLPGPVAAEL